MFDKVYAFEPDSVAFNELSGNVALNGFSNVELNNSAVYNHNDSISIGVGPHPKGMSQTSILYNGDIETVKCQTLRRIFEDRQIPKGQLLKIDIEGAEYCLFDDVEFFKQYRPKIMCEVHLSMMGEDKAKHLREALKNLKPLYNHITPLPIHNQLVIMMYIE